MYEETNENIDPLSYCCTRRAGCGRGSSLTLGEIVQYELQACSEGDREWAYALKSEAYREVVERQFGPWDEKFQRELFAARWKPGISKIIMVDGVAVGLVALEYRDDELWLDELQVVREWRGRGIGSAIVLELLDQAKADWKPLRLQVLKMNTRARDLYDRLGLSVIGETPTHYMMECLQKNA